MKLREGHIWNDYLGKKLLLAAMCLALLTHGVIIYYTLPKTYDAFVHIFFADHYARSWFEPWEYRWYTGFLTTSYPPLVHQAIALLSKLFPLKVAFSIYAILILEVLVVGVYRFTKLFYNKTTAGIAALLVVVLSSIIETLHVYGQMPTLTGIAFLLNALPFLYQYLSRGKWIYLVMSLAFLAVVISSHHVTAIFGTTFFIAPVAVMALTDSLTEDQRRGNLFRYAYNLLIHALKKYRRFLLLGGLLGVLAIGLIFPYWYWSKTDPITQVSIPHGSRDNFFLKPSSGLIFYVIPLAPVFAMLPAIVFPMLRKRRFIGWACSFFICLLFGSGGTTPVPRMVLRGAFDILTLDRFGFWASIIAIPFMAHFIHQFIAGPVRDFWLKRFSSKIHFLLSMLNGVAYLIFIVFIFHLSSFRPLQPREVEIQPILNFLNRDDHMRWRYLTLGFGDQMAWLSANSLAASVDGNYHSARRLPELTSRPVERLENAKYNGQDGLASLNDFLNEAEKYNLKYVFSNDRYYDPLLYYTGWSRAIRLENGIMVWEKGNIPVIQPVTPKSLSPLLKKAWGIFPVGSLIICVLFTLLYLTYYKQPRYLSAEIQDRLEIYPRPVIVLSAILPFLFFGGFMVQQVTNLLLVNEQKDPRTTLLHYYNHLDFQRFENAFHLFRKTPAFTLDQYLLEKSVDEGGLLPAYAKLDSIAVQIKNPSADMADALVYTRWRTSMGLREKRESFHLLKEAKKWYIEPLQVQRDIPAQQIMSYDYLLFKKMGKRVVSSFPTVKDDRIKKPFVRCMQVNLVALGSQRFLTGEILNADDLPVNVSLKAVVEFKHAPAKSYYPSTAFMYNLAPKAASFFQIAIDNQRVLDSAGVTGIRLYIESDVSEKGYLHGSTINYQTGIAAGDSIQVHLGMFNNLTTEITIPGVLVAEKDNLGRIWQTRLLIHPSALRSGLGVSWDLPFKKIEHHATMISDYPVPVFVNGHLQRVQAVMPDPVANGHQGIALLPHCFIAPEIYLQ